jgi:hypothetical protein
MVLLDGAAGWCCWMVLLDASSTYSLGTALKGTCQAYCLPQ